MALPQHAGLKKAGFERISNDIAESLSICSSGKEKRGKTFWAFTAPGPIAVIASDTGTENVVRQMQRAGKEIELYRYQVPPSGEQVSVYDREWVKLENAYQAVLKSDYRTLITDTATEVWEMMRLARFGKLTQVMPHHYGPVNAEFKELVKSVCAKPGLNSIWIHQLKKEYKQGKEGKDAWTGGWERAGFSGMPYLVDAVIEHYIDLDDRSFGVRILDSRYRTAEVLGEELTGGLCSFPMLATLLKPEVDEGEWSDGVELGV